MIRVLVEASDNVSRLVIEVRAGSVRRAVELAGEHCSHDDVSLVFPIEPDAFFVGDGVGGVELVEVVARERRSGDRVGA